MKNENVKIGLRVVTSGTSGIPGLSGEVIGLAWDFSPLICGWIVLLDESLKVGPMAGNRGVCLTSDLMEPENTYRGSGYVV